MDYDERSVRFTPLESPAACPVRSSASIGACSGDEDIIPFRANTGFNAPCEPPRWKVKDFLTGFTTPCLYPFQVNQVGWKYLLFPPG